MTVVKPAPSAVDRSEPVTFFQTGRRRTTIPAARAPALTFAVGAQLVVVCNAGAAIGHSILSKVDFRSRPNTPGIKNCGSQRPTKAPAPKHLFKPRVLFYTPQ